ncbi:MAG: hypothetical protein ACRENA_12050 [Vulcanimicrobiaceae bacterium]
MRYLLAVLVLTALPFAFGVASNAAVEPRQVAISATTPPLPSGDWRNKCDYRKARVKAVFRGNTVTHFLMATCKSDEGFLRETEVQIPCPTGNRATTHNGKLVCA